MSEVFLAAALFLILNVGAGLLRVVRGPTPADRMVAAQLFGTSGVAILLLLSEAADESALRDAALIFALLAVVISVAFLKRGWIRTEATHDGEAVDAD